MRVAAAVVMLAALLVFIQLVTGGTFLLEVAGYPTLKGTSDLHIFMGFFVALVALIAPILAWLSKPKHGALRYSSTIMFVLILLGGSLGFDKPQLLGHYLFAMIIFGTAIATTFYAVRWNRMPKSVVGPSP
jgi:hypothetical protein